MCTVKSFYNFLLTLINKMFFIFRPTLVHNTLVFLLTVQSHRSHLSPIKCHTPVTVL